MFFICLSLLQKPIFYLSLSHTFWLCTLWLDLPIRGYSVRILPAYSIFMYTSWNVAFVGSTTINMEKQFFPLKKSEFPKKTSQV